LGDNPRIVAVGGSADAAAIGTGETNQDSLVQIDISSGMVFAQARKATGIGIGSVRANTLADSYINISSGSVIPLAVDDTISTPNPQPINNNGDTVYYVPVKVVDGRNSSMLVPLEEADVTVTVDSGAVAYDYLAATWGHTLFAPVFADTIFSTVPRFESVPSVPLYNSGATDYNAQAGLWLPAGEKYTFIGSKTDVGTDSKVQEAIQADDNDNPLEIMILSTPTATPTVQPTPSTTVTPSVKPTPTTTPAKKFTVTYQANGGKIGTASKVTKTVTYGKKYAVPANPKRTNYTFQGWYTAKTGGTKVTKNTTVKLTKNQTLYAHWKAKSTVVAGAKFTVTYNAGAGKIGKVQEIDKKVTNGKKYVLPANPTRDRYVFQGWYTSVSGGKKTTKSTTVQLTKNQTLYAQWVVGIAPVFCLYNPNSGEHFYTITVSERDEVVAAGWKYEGISWIAALDGIPVLRVYNKKTGEHVFTMDTRERDRLLALGWRDEGIGFYSDPERKDEILRCYNPNGEPAAQHHYTLNKAERDNLVKAGWIYEGLAWFAK
ncbi:MAG: InlB B-repeat-containing protein, partial [Lachnospiraceae bacterium]